MAGLGVLLAAALTGAQSDLAKQAGDIARETSLSAGATPAQAEEAARLAEVRLCSVSTVITLSARTVIRGSAVL